MKLLKNLNQKNTHLTHRGVIRHLDHTILLDAPENAFLDFSKPNLQMENL